MKKLGLALCLVFACKSSSSTTSQPSPQGPPQSEPAASEPPPPEPTPSPSQAPDTQPAPTTPTVPAQTPPTPPKLKPMMGADCGEGDTCANGLECVKYYGIAGARGPQFKTCEQTCSAKKACPTGSKCVTIADGPGQVCRS